MTKWLVDKTSNSQNGHVVIKKTASWQNDMLVEHQVDKSASWQNDLAPFSWNNAENVIWRNATLVLHNRNYVHIFNDETLVSNSCLKRFHKKIKNILLRFEDNFSLKHQKLQYVLLQHFKYWTDIGEVLPLCYWENLSSSSKLTMQCIHLNYALIQWILAEWRLSSVDLTKVPT